MEIQVRGNGVRINDGLREFIDRRATRLDRMLDRVVDAKLELRALHNRVGPDTTAAQITIRSGREVLRAEERAPDQIVAIDQAFDKLERQIRRVHDKRSRRHAPGQATIRMVLLSPRRPWASTRSSWTTKGRRRARPHQTLRGEADGRRGSDRADGAARPRLLPLPLRGEDIPSVVYRRRDGAYGLLIPKAVRLRSTVELSVDVRERRTTVSLLVA